MPPTGFHVSKRSLFVLIDFTDGIGLHVATAMVRLLQQVHFG
jgi:hypothetical protein